MIAPAAVVSLLLWTSPAVIAPSVPLHLPWTLSFRFGMGFNEYSAQAPEDLSSISKQRGLARVVLQLEPKHLSSSASRWKLDHLVAYRLLVSPGSDFLPILGDHQDHCPLCNDGGPSYTQRLDNVRVQALVGDGAHRLNTKTQRELMQSPDGFFWVALARAAYTEPANQPREQPPRERRPPEREGFVSSVSAIPGSSSPTQPSSSEFEPDEEVSEDENEARRGKPEEVTVHLVICFLQHALSLCLVQHSADAAAVFEVRPRVERRISTARIDDDVDIKAEDDGGIYKVARTALGWETANPYLALLEAKKAFKHIHFDERTGSHLPIVSNEYLAQCFGEAVIAWKANQQWLRRG